MPTWGEILQQLKASADQRGGSPDFDGIRRQYLARLATFTGRDTIIYYSDWLSGSLPQAAITLEDMQGMMEVCKGLKSRKLDLLIHSPGGSAEATASLVRYLRTRFDHIRVIVPLAAMSAGTMWALAADEILMGAHSQLGPIDPQIQVRPGERFTPARAVVEQFERAKEECKADPSFLPAWAPILQQYGPGLLSECEDAEHLAKRLVSEWLRDYMFKDVGDAEAQAAEVADYFADYQKFRSHSLGISRETAREHGLRVTDLENDHDLQDAVLSIHHTTLHTFAGQAVKIIENHLGRAFIKTVQQISIPLQVPAQAVPPQAVPSA